MLTDLRIHPVEHSRIDQVDFDRLGFGGVYSDHMFVMEYRDGHWCDPRIEPYGPLSLAPGVASLHYGQSIFEGLKAFYGVDGAIRLFRPDRNAARLNASAERLCIPAIDPALFVAAVKRLVRIDRDWIPRRRGESLYIRPLLIGTEEYLDVRPARRYLFVIMTAPARAYFEGGAGVALHVQDRYTRAAPGGTGFAKTGGNYAASLLPGERSRAAGYQQALWLDGVEHRYVEEVGQMNIFFRFRDRVVTPALQGTILPGVTRDSLITLLRERGHVVEERRIAIDEVIEGSRDGSLLEAFGAGTAAVVAPVGRIGYRGEDYLINAGDCGPLTRELYQAVTAIQYGETPDTRGWIETVDEPATAAAPAA